MNGNVLTPSTIVELAKTTGRTGVLKVEVEKTKRNKDTTHPTFYIPLAWNCEGSSKGKPRIKLVKQVIASSAKIPHGQKVEDAKGARITFKKLATEDLAVSDYPEKDKAGYIENNHMLIEAFDLICESYDYLVETVVLQYEGKEFQIEGDRSKKTIYTIKQAERKASDADKAEDAKKPKNEQLFNPKTRKMRLPNAFYRIQLGANMAAPGKKIGRQDYNSKKHVYTVFDVRKKTNNNASPFGVAKLKNTGGEFIDLTVANVKHFITYLSMVGGMIELECICISNSGISLIARFVDLYVVPHKVIQNKTLDEDDIAEMSNNNVFANNEDMMIVDEPSDVPTGNKKAPYVKKSNARPQNIPVATEEEQPLDEPTDTHEEEGNEETEAETVETEEETNEPNASSEMDLTTDEAEDNTPAPAPVLTKKAATPKPAAPTAPKPAAARPAVKKAPAAKKA